MPTALFDLSGKVALVTGGNKGLGRAVARGLAEAGADIVISGRDEPVLAAAAAEITTKTGRKATFVVADMADRKDVGRLAETAISRMGRVDVLVNNAGMNAPEAIDAVTDATWDRVIEVNLSSVMALTRAVVPQMKARRWGRVVHLSSIMGQVSKERRNAYSATKSALMGLARASALDLGPFNVTVNCIAPGPFLTDMPMSVLSDAEKEVFASRTALGRWGQPPELVGPVLMLCSEAGSYVTGQTLFVDGGYLAANPGRAPRVDRPTGSVLEYHLRRGYRRDSRAPPPVAASHPRQDGCPMRTVSNACLNVYEPTMARGCSDAPYIKSVYTDCVEEANRFKWIESEKAGYDLGEPAIRRWVKDHWTVYLRAKWLEHLHGKCFWIELDRGDFGLLQREFKDQQILLDDILDRLKAGQENLDVIAWAINRHVPLEPVLQILEALDINSRRLAHQFESRC